MTTTTIQSKKVSARELNDIADLYFQLRSDYCACVGKKEIEYWILTTECCIDRQVKILDRGVDKKRNATHFQRLNDGYNALQERIAEAHVRLARLQGR